MFLGLLLFRLQETFTCTFNPRRVPNTSDSNIAQQQTKEMAAGGCAAERERVERVLKAGQQVLDISEMMEEFSEYLQNRAQSRVGHKRHAVLLLE